MGAPQTNTKKYASASSAATYRGEPSDAPQAARCRCEERGMDPWLERDPDHGHLHCCRCGSDYTRVVL